MSCGRCLSHLGWKYTWVGPDWEDESGSSLMSGDEDDDMDDDDFVTIEDEDGEETGDENSLSPDAESHSGEERSVIADDHGLIVDVAVADEESPTESPVEYSPPGLQESTLDDSSSSDSAANQTILQEFW